MATMQAAQLEPAMLEVVEKVLTKHFEEKTKITKRVAEGGGINTRGRRIPVYVGANPSFNWFPEAGSYASPGQTTDIETKVYPVRCSAGFEFSGTYFRQAGTPESLLKGLTQYMARTQSSALKKFEQAFCATNTGEIGVVAAIGAQQVTMATSFAQGSLFGARKFARGQVVSWYSPAGVQRTVGATSSTVSTTTPPVQSSGLVTFQTALPTDLAVGDIAVFGDPPTAGSYNRAPNGLQDFIGNTGTIQGQARAAYPELNAYVDDAGGAAISQIRLRKLTSAITTFRTEADSISFTIVSSRAQFDLFERQLLNLIRYTPGGEGKQELKPGFGDCEWMYSPDIHDDRVYFLDFSCFKRHDLKKWGRYNEDGLDWRLFFATGTAMDKFTGWLGWEGNFSCNHFNVHGVIKNLAVPTDAALGYAVVQ